MNKLTQSRLHHPPKEIGNCFSTVIACLMDFNNPEDVIQIQEYYNQDWVSILLKWLSERGWIWEPIDWHLYNGKYYLVVGNTVRSQNVRHVCVYLNGELYWDPHPSGVGLINEESFEIIYKK